jgi:glycosyltransferase involved in cell wall biosynthesis
VGQIWIGADIHSFMRALPSIQKEHKTCHTLIVGGDEVSYGSRPKDAKNWREKLLMEVGDQLDPTRTHFLGKLSYPDYKRVLQVSAAHVYLTYPFVLSWSMLEAMATGCLVIGSDTAPVREVVVPGENGLVPFFGHDDIAQRTLERLCEAVVSAARSSAMQTAAATYSIQDVIPAISSVCLAGSARTAIHPKWRGDKGFEVAAFKTVALEV